MTSTFRTRDFIAIIILVCLTSMAYYPNSYDESDLSASIRFAFFLPHHQDRRINPTNTNPNRTTTSLPVLVSMFDIDGDDISEAFALWRNNHNNDNNNNNVYEGSKEEWSLHILDLSRISLSTGTHRRHHPSTDSSSSRTTSSTPFQPLPLFNTTVVGTVANPHAKMSKYYTEERMKDGYIRFYPVATSTGHIVFPHSSTSTANHETVGDTATQPEEEPTHYYYCGIDWHDASEKCQTPCPSGSGCPEGQRCFAECRSCPSNTAAIKDRPDQPPPNQNVEYHTTVAGGWPSICTVWSQGRITMHTITAEKEIDPTTSTTTTTTSTTTSSTSSDTHPKPPSSKLQLRQLWNVSILVPDGSESYYRDNGTQPMLELEEVAITFVDPISAGIVFPLSSSHGDKSPNTNHGIVLVTGTVTAYYYQAVEHRIPDYDYYIQLRDMDATFVIAYDAYTGRRIWHTTSSYEMEHLLFYPESRPSQPRKPNTDPDAATTVPMLLPRHGQISSILRRRSGMVSIHQRQRIMEESSYQEYEALKRRGATSHINCLKEYRRSIFTTIGTLPHQYDGTNDYSAKVIVTHFDHQGVTTTAPTTKHKHPKSPRHSKSGRSKKSKNRFTNHVEFGRPNVVVVHNYEGIHVHALRNGRSLCHISLSDSIVYDDIDHDGIIDSVQLSNMGEWNNMPRVETEVDDDGVLAQNKLYESLQEQLVQQHMNGSLHDNDDKGDNTNMMNDMGNRMEFVPCYRLSVVSGLAAVEPTHVKTISCQRSDFSRIDHAPILLIDTPMVVSNHHHHPDQKIRYYKDVIVALNNGMVGRMHGKFGDWVWENEIHDSENVHTKMPHPTWNDSSMVALQQLYVHHDQSTDSPILLAGQDSIAILSSRSGRVVASVALPQRSTIQRPYIFDMNGDGTSDIVVVTNDAIWGYTILVRTTNGMSTWYRLLVGFIMLGLMLAYLRNRFGPHPGKRSTDL